MDVNEALKQLEDVLEAAVRVDYFNYLAQWFKFHTDMTKDVFDEKVRSLFRNSEQIVHHNNFLLALLSKAYSNHRTKPFKQVNNKGQFEAAEYADYVLPSKRRTEELLAPDSPIMSCRINIAAWRCGLAGADRKVTQLMVFACQSFLKNLATAIVTKARGYKVRDGQLQHGFSLPMSDPHISNSDTWGKEDYEKPSTYGISDLGKKDLIVNAQLLLETIRDNPKLLGQHGVHSVQSVKLSFLDDADHSPSGDDSDC